MLVLLTPLIVTPNVYFPFIVGKALYARSVIEITFALWVVLVLFHPERRPRRSWILLAFGIWLGVSCLAALLGVSPTRSMWSTYERMQGVFDLAHWFAFALMASSVFRDFSEWRAPLSASLFVSALVCALGVGQYYGILESQLVGSQLESDSTRVSSTLGNPTYVSVYALTSALIGAGLIIHSLGRSSGGEAAAPPRGRAARRRRRRRQATAARAFDYVPWIRALWSIAILVDLWAMWLSGSRGAVVGLAAATLVFSIGYLLWGRMKPARIAAAAILAVSIATVALYAIIITIVPIEADPRAPGMMNRLLAVSVGTEDPSIRGRVVSAQVGIEVFLDRPLLGWGPENYLIGWGRHFDADSGVLERFDQAHNKPLEELATRGVAGLIAYLSVWGATAFVVVRSFMRRAGPSQIFVGIVGSALAAYFVQNIFLFDTPVTVMQFSMLVAFAASEESWIRSRDEPSSLRRASGVWRVGVKRLTSALTSPIGSKATAAIVVILTLASLVWFNIRPYAAAAEVVQGTTEIRDWSDRLDSFQSAIRGFPNLANYARLRMIVDSIPKIVETSNDYFAMTDREFERTVSIVSEEGAEAIAAEPQNWLLEVTLARFFQVAANRDPSHLQTARKHIDRAVELAPRTIDSVNVLQEQERIEEIVGKQ